MRSPRFRRTRAGSWSPCRIPFACSVIAFLGTSPAPLVGQEEAVVDALAAVLAAEDARRFDAATFDEAARHPEPVVRRHAALAMGRIRDTRALPNLVELLADPDSVVRRDAALGLGLLGSADAVAPLGALVRQTPAAEQRGEHLEAVAAIARIGGAAAAAWVANALFDWSGALERDDVPPAAVRLLGEAWRLESRAPVAALVRAAAVRDADARVAAVYSLARLRAPQAGAVMLAAADARTPRLRELAARTLTRPYAEAAALDPRAVADRLARLVEDDDAATRIHALRSLGTFGLARHAPLVTARTADDDPNVRVAALEALGRLGGADARRAALEQVGAERLAIRAAALGALARLDRRAAIGHAAAWILDGDWTVRGAGAAALGLIGGDTALAWLDELSGDADGRVAARALAALAEANSARARAASRRRLGHQDPAVRALAARQIQAAPTVADAALLADAFAAAEADEIAAARLAAVEALGAVARLGDAGRAAVETAFVRRFPTCDDYHVHRAAAQHLPAAAAQWGAAPPVATGRIPDDYRDIARRLLLPAERRGARPALVIETDRGTIVVELYAADAPLTADAFLRLADRQYFDGGRWHRVVPAFVIQDGDPRGDGWGGPGFALRDEINQHRFGPGSVGVAHSGPDTGGSQFFVTLGPEPHLDGTYTVFGRVARGMEVVRRTTEGDRIRTVRRRERP